MQNKGQSFEVYILNFKLGTCPSFKKSDRKAKFSLILIILYPVLKYLD
jgi:hypothetical protein